MSHSESLIAELESSVQNASSDKRLNTLRRVTDLFLDDTDHLNEEQIKVFDDVLCHLMKQVESKALVELSGRLAPIEKAPDEAIRRLAHDDEITVAGPVLAESKRLTTEDLAEIARTKGQGHLLAISGREGLAEEGTDALVERGNRAVVVQLAGNSTVRFSKTGYGTLVKRAEGDDLLAEKVGRRLDVPPKLLEELLFRATEAVRAKLLSTAPPQVREDISRVLATISSSVAKEATKDAAKAADFSLVAESVRSMHQKGKLDDAAILAFAEGGQCEEVAVALALLCSAPLSTISQLMTGLRNDAVLIPCKAAKLQWPTVEAILRHRLAGRTLPERIIDLARNDFNRLSVATAQRTLRFLQVRTSVA